MSILDSLLVSVSGMGVVFVVLIALCFFIIVQSKCIGMLKFEKETVVQTPADKTEKVEKEDAGITAGELKLIDVDEKTAAIIMAIVSDESKIPLSELRFKSIRALD